MPEPIVRLHSVGRVYRTGDVDNHVLRDVSLRVEEGEYVAITGPSGCGKTTLLSILGLLDAPTDGEYRLNGRDVSLLGGDERAVIRGNEIGFVFQSFNLIGDLTVYDNVELPLVYRGLPAPERRERVYAALERVGMAARAAEYPARLSGGQHQRVAIARALTMEPKVLLFDEPTSALDPSLVGEVLKVMESLAHEGRTMIVVTHEMQFAREAADRVYYMEDGVFVEIGPPEAVIDRPRDERTRQFLARFLGAAHLHPGTGDVHIPDGDAALHLHADGGDAHLHEHG
jgi:putative ABC transport system ATP-binding protein